MALNELDARRRRFLYIIPAIIILIVLAGFLYLKKPAAPPAQLVDLADTVNYSVYYPSRLPGGYVYTGGSAKIQTGLLYYKLHNGAKTITVTQQPVVGSPINLQKLPQYKSLDVPAGPAAIGVSVGNPSAVIATGSTLVNINSSKGVSKDSVIAIAKKIKAIKTGGSD